MKILFSFIKNTSYHQILGIYSYYKFLWVRKNTEHRKNEKVYYKSLSDSNWREKDCNWACFYFQKKLCVGWGGKIFLFRITNITNYYLFYVIIAIWERIVQYFSSYLYDIHCIFASILLITYKRILYVNKLTWKLKIHCFHVNDMKILFLLY